MQLQGHCGALVVVHLSTCAAISTPIDIAYMTHRQNFIPDLVKEHAWPAGQELKE